MSKETLVFEVTDASYGKYVMLNSHKVPVVLAFIGVWSEHCFALDHMFVRLAEEFAEQFIFAKIDIDENAESKQKYDIVNVPTLIVFRDGEVVRREEGLMSEDEARELLKDFDIYRESDEQRMQARALHMQGDTPAAITQLAKALQSDPENTRIALDLVQIFIDIREFDEAVSLLGRLPDVDQEGVVGRGLRGQLDTHKLAGQTDGAEKLMQRIEQDAEDFDAHFDLAICLVADNNYAEAMNHLFHLVDVEPDYKGGAPREMIVSLIDALTENSPQMAQLYRRQLANTLNE